ncbi:hypothetical protein FB451DRAFT_1046317, partial [Mycena latifolia]
SQEYIQNMIGQILKDLETREWSDWTREDLMDKSNDERALRKSSLIDAYPGLPTGPHGASLIEADCLPLYILSANIPIPAKTDFTAVIVLWTIGSRRTALSFYNNHLDESATFDSFAVDGASTSIQNQWAVGEKGKGFILATQYWVERIEQWNPLDESAGVSFRVGEQIGKLKWKLSRKTGNPDSLQLILDDLTTRTEQEYLRHKYHQACLADIDNAADGGDPPIYNDKMESPKMRDKARHILNEAKKRRIALRLNMPDGTSVVKPDQVCITIIGVDPTLGLQALFSTTFGIVAPPHEWRIGNVQFFSTCPHPPQFYHRDQLVPGGNGLNRISINYHGDLSLTSEHLMVQHDRKYLKYRSDVCASAHQAFHTIPDLALELALDILTDEHSDALAGIVKPVDRTAAAAYRVAFETAMRQLSPGILPGTSLHPYARPDINLRLFMELGLTPFKVSYRALEIIYQSGTYLPIADYARSALLAAPPTNTVQGLDRLQAALKIVVPFVEAESITIRNYDKLYPTAIWDNEQKAFAFTLPKPCEEHADGRCLCWIGPSLQDAAKDYNLKNPPIPLRRVFRAYLSCMGGDNILTTVDSAAPMDVGTYRFQFMAQY